MRKFEIEVFSDDNYYIEKVEDTSPLAAVFALLESYDIELTEKNKIETQYTYGLGGINEYLIANDHDLRVINISETNTDV